MSTKAARWLHVAKRASEFRALIGTHELTEANHRAEAAHEALRLSQAQSLTAQKAWRNHMSKPQFHASDDVQYRRYQGVLRETEASHGAHADKAQMDMHDAQRALRLQLAEKNALLAAIERAGGLARNERARLTQREADEVWVIAQSNKGVGP